jgi:hypothetical protein
VTIDGPFLVGLAALITAIAGVLELTRRGVKKRRAGVPAREDEIDHDLIDDKRELIAEVDELHTKLDALHELRIKQMNAAEQRRVAEARLYQEKIDELVRERNALADTAARNRRRFIEKYGEDQLHLFIAPPNLAETWSAAEIREFRRLANDPIT